MKNRIFISILICIIVTVITNITHIYAEDTVVDKQNGILTYLGILKGSDFEGEYVTNSEFYNVIKRIPVNSDIDRGFAAKNAIITKKSAITEILKLTGHSLLIKNDDDYIKVAISIGLDKGINYSDKNLLAKEYITLLENLLEIRILEAKEYTGDSLKYSSGNTFLYEYYGIVHDRAQLSGFGIHTLYGDITYDNYADIVIDGETVHMLYSCDLSYDMLGKTLDVYYYDDEEHERELIYCKKRDNFTETEIYGDDIYSVEGSVAKGFTVRYTLNDKDEKIVIEPLADYVYNTVADSSAGITITSSMLENLCGTLKIVKSNNKTVVFVNESKITIVDKLNTNKAIIYGKKDINNISYKTEDKENGDIELEIYKNNKQITVNEIEQNDIITSYYADVGNKQVLLMYVSNDKYSGRLTHHSEDEIGIDTTIYKKTKALKLIERDYPDKISIDNISNYITVFLDDVGRVVWYEKGDEDYLLYGYMTYIGLNDDETVSIKMYTQNNEWKIYQLSDNKVITNEGSVKAAQLLSSSFYGLIDGEGKTIQQLVKYKRDYLGEVKYLYIPQDKDDEIFSTTEKITNGSYVSTISGILDTTTRDRAIHISGSTVVFVVPDKSDNAYYDKFLVTDASYFNNDTYDVEGYDSDKYGIHKAVVTKMIDSGKVSEMILVDEIYETVKDDDIVIALSGYSKGENKEYIIKDIYSAYDDAKKLKKGDIITVHINGRNDIDLILDSKIVKMPQNFDGFKSQTQLVPSIFNSDFSVAKGYVERIDYEKGYILIRDDSGSMLYAVQSNIPCMKVQLPRPVLGVASIEDIETDDFVVMKIGWSNINEIVVYKEK